MIERFFGLGERVVDGFDDYIKAVSIGFEMVRRNGFGGQHGKPGIHLGKAHTAHSIKRADKVSRPQRAAQPVVDDQTGIFFRISMLGSRQQTNMP